VSQREVSDAGEQTTNALVLNTWPSRPEKTFATRETRLERWLPSYWRVTLDFPPVNIFGPKEMLQLGEIITAIAASQKRIKALMERGCHRAGDVENRLGFHVGQLGG